MSLKRITLIIMDAVKSKKKLAVFTVILFFIFYFFCLKGVFGYYDESGFAFYDKENDVVMYYGYITVWNTSFLDKHISFVVSSSNDYKHEFITSPILEVKSIRNIDNDICLTGNDYLIEGFQRSSLCIECEVGYGGNGIAERHGPQRIRIKII